MRLMYNQVGTQALSATSLPGAHTHFYTMQQAEIRNLLLGRSSWSVAVFDSCEPLMAANVSHALSNTLCQHRSSGQEVRASRCSFSCSPPGGTAVQNGCVHACGGFCPWQSQTVRPRYSAWANRAQASQLSAKSSPVLRGSFWGRSRDIWTAWLWNVGSSTLMMWTPATCSKKCRRPLITSRQTELQQTWMS